MRGQGARSASLEDAPVRCAHCHLLVFRFSRVRLTRRGYRAQRAADASAGVRSAAAADGERVAVSEGAAPEPLCDALLDVGAAAAAPPAGVSKRKRALRAISPPALDEATAAIVAAARVAAAAALAKRTIRAKSGAARSGAAKSGAAGASVSGGRRPARPSGSGLPPSKKAKKATKATPMVNGGARGMAFGHDDAPDAPRTAPPVDAAPGAAGADAEDVEDVAPSFLQLRRGWFWMQHVAPYFGDDAGRNALRCCDALLRRQQPAAAELAYRIEARAAAAADGTPAADDDALLLAPLGMHFRARWAALDGAGEGLSLRAAATSGGSGAAKRKHRRGGASSLGPRAKPPPAVEADEGVEDLFSPALTGAMTPPPLQRGVCGGDAEALSALLGSLCATPCADADVAALPRGGAGLASALRRAVPLSPFASPAGAFAFARGSPAAVTPADAPSPTPLAALLAATSPTAGAREVMSPLARALIAPCVPPSDVMRAADALSAWLEGQQDVMELVAGGSAELDDFMPPPPLVTTALSAPAEPHPPVVATEDEVGAALREVLAALAAARSHNGARIVAARAAVVAAVRAAPPASALERQIRALADDVAARLIATPLQLPMPQAPATPLLPSRAAAAGAVLALEAAAAAARRDWIAWLAADVSGERAALLHGAEALPADVLRLRPGEKGPWTPQPPPKCDTPAALAKRCASLAAALLE